ncbi:DUF262 domain-containing protein [Kribbella sp. NPDC050281]|uniref:GmrSD restriction endonuclease domain-containing protein n=1 Tax=Kribbella sp. NPDC050281 TaxID=3155515 RepID=UPI0033E60F5C
MADHLSIQDAITRLLQGTIRIPGFQRKFVWPPNKAAQLMDSIYKQYPIGSLLLWRTSSRLRSENRLGVFDLPEPEKQWPVDYVLDGQQRLTSIFTTFQRRLPAKDLDPEAWLPIYYDFAAAADAQESRFEALESNAADPERYFPLSTFFEPVEFSHLTRDLSEEQHREIAEVQQRFLTSLLPIQTFETEDRTSVAIVFERVNRMGIPLDTYQLLTAWTWSDDFDLQGSFQEMAQDYESFGFEDVGDDSDLMMRCCAAVLTHDPSPNKLVLLRGAEVRERFETVKIAISRAIDFVRDNFHARHVRFLPYPALLIPLAAFFSIDQHRPVTSREREVLVRWFWRSCFSHRYSGNPQGFLRRDIVAAVALRRGQDHSLAEMNASIEPSFFINNAFQPRTVAGRTLILLLASQSPRSLLSGELLNLNEVLSEPNRREYHHCFPRAFLASSGRTTAAINALANFVLISRADNRVLGGVAPSEYRKLLADNLDEVLASAMLTHSLFDDDYDAFIKIRANVLAKKARVLAGVDAV